MITTETIYSKKMYDELFNNSVIICAVDCVIGAIFLILYIIMYILSNSQVLYLLYCGVFLFVFGLLLTIITLKQKNNQIKKDKNKVETIIFNEDYMITYLKDNTEITATEKVYYKNIIKIRETKNYLFLYPNRAIAYPISKNKLKINEIEQIKNLIKNNK